MYLCVSVHICTCVHICTYLFISIHVYISVRICTYLWYYYTVYVKSPPLSFYHSLPPSFFFPPSPSRSLLPLSLPPSFPSSPLFYSDRVGPLMWLECRQMLAWSLLHLHTHPHPPSSPLSLSTVCSEGISEATSSGMPEVVAWFNWCLAVHNMTHSPSDTSRSISLLEVRQPFSNVVCGECSLCKYVQSHLMYSHIRHTFTSDAQSHPTHIHIRRTVTSNVQSHLLYKQTMLT